MNIYGVKIALRQNIATKPTKKHKNGQTDRIKKHLSRLFVDFVAKIK